MRRSVERRSDILAQRRAVAAPLESRRDPACLAAQWAELATEKPLRLTALQRLGLALGTPTGRRALLTLVAETVRELASARGAVVLLPGEDGVMEVAAANGIAVQGIGPWPTTHAEAFARPAGGWAARVLAAGEAPAPLRDLMAAHGIETLMVAPVPGPHAGFAGALVVLDPRARAGEALEALEAAAAQAGAALARLRLQRQSARRARRARLLAAAIDHLQLGVAIAGPDGRIRYANAAAARLRGTERRALRGLRLDDLFPSAPVLLQGKDADSWSCEVLHQRADGSAIPVHLTVMLLRARSGGRLATVLIARDVSDEKRQQSQLMESDRLALVGGLVSAVAHELNNPLAAIGNFAELLRADEEDAERKEMLDTIAHEAARAGRTVRNLLSFSRPSCAARQWVRISKVVDRTIALRIYDQRRRRIEVGIEIPPDLSPVWADANQLQQVLLNLIVNAEQAIGSDGRIDVRARPRGKEMVELIVEDTGPGIDPAVLPQIFTPFVTTKAAHVGTGLGLSISRDIVEAHGGRITAENRPEGGARFVVILPTTAAPAARSDPSAR